MTKYKGIPIENIYYMLAYAFDTVPDDYMIENLKKEKFENIYDFFAAILAKGISRQLKQGLYREYRSRKEDIATLRGKINMPGTISNRMARKRLLTCEYDELTENNLLNQILKTTALLLIRHSEAKDPKDSKDPKADLKKEMPFFSSVDIIEPALIRWDSIRFQRNNRTYQMLIGVCWLVLEGMLLTTQKGEYRLPSFVNEEKDDKNNKWAKLYEKFILNYYKKEWLGEITAEASEIEWALDDKNSLPQAIKELLPIMKTDITLTHDQKVLIIDAKFYGSILQETGTVHSNNLYQIFSYVKNTEVNCNKNASPGEKKVISGMLLYAQTDPETEKEKEKIKEIISGKSVYKMSGNDIYIKALNLSNSFQEISRQLDEVAANYFGIQK